MLEAVQGRDTSVRDTISKGRFVQGAQHPRIFGRGHIGRGHINPASLARRLVYEYVNIYLVLIIIGVKKGKDIVDERGIIKLEALKAR